LFSWALTYISIFFLNKSYCDIGIENFLCAGSNAETVWFPTKTYAPFFFFFGVLPFLGGDFESIFTNSLLSG